MPTCRGVNQAPAGWAAAGCGMGAGLTQPPFTGGRPPGACAMPPAGCSPGCRPGCTAAMQLGICSGPRPGTMPYAPPGMPPAAAAGCGPGYQAAMGSHAETMGTMGMPAKPGTCTSGITSWCFCTLVHRQTRASSAACHCWSAKDASSGVHDRSRRPPALGHCAITEAPANSAHLRRADPWDLGPHPAGSHVGQRPCLVRVLQVLPWLTDCQLLLHCRQPAQQCYTRWLWSH